MYIRTKDGVYDTSKGLYTPSIKMWAIGTVTIYDEDILKQSENLEELCDEFVLKTTSKESGKSYYGLYYYSDIKHFKVKEGYKGVWYGAVWTNKGLIYVAKMNDKGELELI